MTSQLALIHRSRTPAAAVTILADLTTLVAIAPEAGTITSVTYTPSAAITGAASPASRTFTLTNRGQAGLGTTVAATLAMVAGVNGVAYDEKPITLSGTAANLVVAAGDVLTFESTHVGGTGLVDPGGLVAVEITRS
jgi:hypothetical protein